MLGVLPVLFPILLVDVVNPVLLAAVIYSLGGRKPVLLSSMVLLGWTVVYYISGVFIAIGLESITSFLENPRTVDFYIELVVAALLLFFGFRFLFPKKKAIQDQGYGDSSHLNAFGAFGIGATINAVGLPFAIPYFAALDQILKANLGWIESLLVLLIYNLLYIAPFVMLIVIKMALGQEGEKILQTMNSWMDRIGKVVLPGMMIVLAVVLIIDAIMFFTTGTPWF
jgi:cytochrome c biogenesis protein CcdA